MARTYTEDEYNAVLTSTAAQLKALSDGIDEKLKAKDTERTEVEADRDKCKALADDRYAFILKAEDALTNGASIEEVRAILDPLIVKEKTPEQEKENAEIDRLEQELRDELQKRIDELEAKRAEINK